MDAVVTARVPVEIKEQGNALLKSIGSTPTQLVNAAYEFLLSEKELPRVEDNLVKEKGTHRKLSVERQKEIADSLSVMRLGASSSQEGFRDRLNRARDERYAHSA